MTEANATLIHDAKVLIRESLHVKRAAGWGDFLNQFIAALEQSEARREELEQQLALARRVLPPTARAVYEEVRVPAYVDPESFSAS